MGCLMGARLFFAQSEYTVNVTFLSGGVVFIVHRRRLRNGGKGLPRAGLSSQRAQGAGSVFRFESTLVIILLLMMILMPIFEHRKAASQRLPHHSRVFALDGKLHAETRGNRFHRRPLTPRQNHQQDVFFGNLAGQGFDLYTST